MKEIVILHPEKTKKTFREKGKNFLFSEKKN